MENDKEICICAAILMPDGYIIRGHRHHDCFRTARHIPEYFQNYFRRIHGETKEDKSLIVQGFITSKNRFVDRDEGLRLQRAAGIESAAKKYGDDYRSKLFSEDLY